MTQKVLTTGIASGDEINYNFTKLFNKVGSNMSLDEYEVDKAGLNSSVRAISNFVADVGTGKANLPMAPGIYLIDSDYTIPSNINIVPEMGAVFYIASGVTLTINGSISAGVWQIFSGLGTVDGFIKSNKIKSEWFASTITKKVPLNDRKFKPQLGGFPYLSTGNLKTSVMTNEEIIAYTQEYANAGIDNIGVFVDIEPNNFNSFVNGIGLDDNVDGESDNWSKFASPGITETTQINSEIQEITISASSNGDEVQFFNDDIEASAGDEITVKIQAKMTGTDVQCRFYINWYDDEDNYLSTSLTIATTTSSTFAELSVTDTAPTDTTIARVVFAFKSTAADGTGIGYFKNSLETYDILETTPKIQLLVNTAISLGLDISCLKFHNLYAQQNIVKMNLAQKTSWKTQHKAHMVTVLDLFDSSAYDIPYSCVLNEAYDIWIDTDVRTEVIDFIDTAQTYGYSVGMSGGAIDNKDTLPSALIDEIDVFMINTYPSISNLLDSISYQDGVDGWMSSNILDQIKYFKQLYPSIPIIISETGTQANWRALSAPEKFSWFATGTLTFTGVVADGETITIGTDIFEFDTDASVSGSNILVDVSGGVTASDAVTALALVINVSGTENVYAVDGVGDTIDLTTPSYAVSSEVITETNCLNATFSSATLDNYWDVVNGEPTSIFLNGMLEVLDTKDIEQVWVLYDINYPYTRNTIKTHLGGLI